MMRLFLFAALLLGGCTLSRPSPTALYQAEGVTLALSVRPPGGGAGGVVAGELLAVEPGAFLIDAVDHAGQPIRVVRVPMQAIARGSAYLGTVPFSEIRSVIDTPYGMRRIAGLGAGGQTRRVDLRALSRFPTGIPDAALARLLHARVQTEVADLDFAPIRSTL